MTQGPSFAGGHESPCPFIQERPEGGEFLLELTERFHARNHTRFRTDMQPLFIYGFLARLRNQMKAFFCRISAGFGAFFRIEIPEGIPEKSDGKMATHSWRDLYHDLCDIFIHASHLAPRPARTS